MAEVDTVNKVVRLRFADVTLDWCKGTVPTSEGPIDLRWSQAGAKMTYQLTVPPGFFVEVENLTGKTLTRQ